MAESKIETHVNVFELDGYEQLAGIVDGRLPGAPLADTLGFTSFELLSRGSVAVALVPEARHYNPLGTVHGGVHSALLDTVCGCSVHSTLGKGEAYVSLDLTVKFLRPVTMDSGRLRAVGTVMHRGRSTALAEAKLFDAAEKLVAYATSTCKIFA